MTDLDKIGNRQEVTVGDALGQNNNYKLLMSYGIFKGTRLTVIRNDRWQGMILVEFEGRRIAIRRKDASCIKVEPVNGK
ncbi:MAG: ferrous iron transport protein A [Saprospiraceae bacterium]